MNFNLEELKELLITYGTKFAIAVVVLIVGLWIVGIINNAISRTLEKRNMDAGLRGFMKSIIGTGLKIALIITALSQLGIEMTSFVALIGAAGLAIGMALSGSLQNFAGGFMILTLKPFKVGDFVELQGHAGVVKEIQIFHTILKTGDNKTIIIPNAPISNGSLINYSTEETRRVDMVFGIGYSDDIDLAKATLQNLLDSDTRILKDPATFIAVKELADSSVNFVVRAWVKSGDYWGVYFDMQETVKKTFDAKNISIPFPQTDVHLFKEN